MALRKSLSSFRPVLQRQLLARSFASAPSKIDLDSSLNLQKARTWDEGVKDEFAVTPLAEIFKGKKVVIFGLPGAYTGVCTTAHVPSYLKNFEALKAKGVDAVACVSINDPYVMKAWAKSMAAEEKIDFYGDYDGSFHKLLGLNLDLSKALLGARSQRWSALVEDGEIKALNVEDKASDLNLSSAEYILKQL